MAGTGEMRVRERAQRESEREKVRERDRERVRERESTEGVDNGGRSGVYIVKFGEVAVAQGAVGACSAVDCGAVAVDCGLWTVVQTCSAVSQCAGYR